MPSQTSQWHHSSSARSTSAATTATSSSLGALETDEPHHLRRFFLGPMPERVLSQTETQARNKSKTATLLRALSSSSSSAHTEASVNRSQVVKSLALRLFIQEGGDVNNWGYAEEEGTREEMLRKWKESEWGKTWSRRERQGNQPPSQRWVGQTFEVGTILGVQMLQEPSGSISERAVSSIRSRDPSDVTSPGYSTNAGASSYMTAKSSFNGSELVPTIQVTRPSPDPDHVGVPSANGEGSPANSRTALIERTPTAPEAPRPRVSLPNLQSAFRVKSENQLDVVKKGKGKAVHYADLPERPSTPDAAPPAEVLARTGPEVEGTSAGAVSGENSPIEPEPLNWGDVFMRDRMMVRVGYSKAEFPNPQLFDDERSRTTAHLQYEDWWEYMVVWRMNRLELYQESGFLSRVLDSDKLHLEHVIPIKSSKTAVSLYSFVDLTFCLTCAPTRADTSNPLARLHREKPGLNVFVFKVKSRSRALDWIWHLWRAKGGDIPRSLEVRSPVLDTRLKIDVPADDDERLFEQLSRDNLVELCLNSLMVKEDWKTFIESELSRRKVLRLAWRLGSNMEWVWYDDDVEGYERKWSVLCGLALKQSTETAHLELRLSQHTPASVHLSSRTSRLSEPPAIEGYLSRIKPSTLSAQQIYLSVHSGCLFTINPTSAHPPSPPGLETLEQEASPLEMRRMEVERGARQMFNATGVTDLRSVLRVRRAERAVSQPTHEEREVDEDGWAGVYCQPVEGRELDERDEGGEEGLSKSENREETRTKRTFELLMLNGHVARFEAQSCRVATEWVERLRALVLFWKLRHREDAADNMDLARGTRPRLTPQTHVHHDHELPPEPPLDLTQPSAALGNIYNWCVLEGCHPVVKCGSLFIRRGLHGHYRLIHAFLTGGHLLQFHIKSRLTVHPVCKSKINLVDAYICSGYFAALSLPRGQFDPTAPPVPRRYQDGLETDDPEDDTMFMIWYRKQAPSSVASSETQEPPPSSAHVPPLSAKRKVAIFRARSKLERDAWCWALNCEIDRLVRAQKDRESRLRETGKLVPIKKGLK